MTRHFFGCLALICLCNVCCTNSFVQAQALPVAQTPIAQKSDLALCEALLSQDEQERDTSAHALTVRQSAIINSLVAKLNAQRTAPDTKFGGSFHQIVIVLGAMRATDAVSSLVGLVDTRLTGHPPIGAFGGPTVYYPVANALISIGGPNVNKWLFDRLGQTASEDLIRVCTWVIVQANTEAVARLMIEARLERVSAVLKKIGIADTNPEKQNLERMLQLLDSKEPLLPDPEIAAPQTNNPNTPKAPVAGQFGAAGVQK